MALAVYGKHPAKGDFLDYGVPGALKPLLEGWLDTVLAQARDVLGAEWQTVWPQAPLLRFWLGEGIWGTPVAGVIAPSQDRVGRRFPLVLLALEEAGTALPPPVIDADQVWYDAACAHLSAVLAQGDLGGPADLLVGAPILALTDPTPGPAAFWAVRPGVDVGNLLADIAMTDHRRASEGRSYWWVAGSAEEMSVTKLLSVGGVPDTDVTAADAPQAQAEVPAQDLFVPESDPWGLAHLPEPDDSPFDAAPKGLNLFAPPEPGSIETVEVACAPFAPPAPRVLWSQVWAGPGLPSGDVLAWFFRGHVGND